MSEIDPPLGRVGMIERGAGYRNARRALAGWPMSRVGRAREHGKPQSCMSVLESKTVHARDRLPPSEAGDQPSLPIAVPIPTPLMLLPPSLLAGGVPAFQAAPLWRGRG